MAQDLIYDLELRLEKAEKDLNRLNTQTSIKAKQAGKTAGVNYGRAMAAAIGSILSKISFDAILNVSNQSIQAFDKVTKSSIALESAIKGINKQLAQTGRVIELEEVNAEIDALFNQFEGVVAKGTISKGFANLFNAGITSAEQATEVMEGFVNIASTSDLPLNQAVENLTQAYKTESSELGDLSGLTDNFASQIIPRGLKALQEEGKLRDKKIDELTKEERALAKVAGLQENFNLTQGNFNKQLKSGALEQDKFNAEVLKARQEFGKAIKPLQILVFEALTPLIQKITEFITENPEVTAAIAVTVSAITGLTTVALGLVSALSFLAPAFGTILTFIKGSGGVIAAFTALANPIGMFIGLFALIGGAIALLYNKWEWFRVEFDARVQEVKNTITGLKDNFWFNISKIIGFFVTLPFRAVQEMINFLKAIGREVMNFDWAGLWENMVNAFKDAIDDIIAYFKSGKLTDALKNAIKDAGSGFLEGASGFIPKFADGGIVPGNSFVGDKVNAKVNSGEMILNRQQQAGLFGMLKNMATGNTTNNNTTNNYGVDFGPRFANPNFI